MYGALFSIFKAKQQAATRDRGIEFKKDEEQCDVRQRAFGAELTSQRQWRAPPQRWLICEHLLSRVLHLIPSRPSLSDWLRLSSHKEQADTLLQQHQGSRKKIADHVIPPTTLRCPERANVTLLVSHIEWKCEKNDQDSWRESQKMTPRSNTSTKTQRRRSL